MDLFIDINNHSNYLNRFLLPDYTYNDLYIRSLNMAFRLKEQNSKYILCFLPNCIEYIECIFASIIANVNTLHCSYSNILKFILLPDIDLILTTRDHLKIIDLLLKKCNSEIASDIMDKCIVVDGYTNGNYIETKSIITAENKEKLYSLFLNSNTNYVIFPSDMDENNNFLKTSVQYIQYQSFQIEEPYSKEVYTLYPYDMNTLKGMVFLFHIINSRRCIIDLKASYRFHEDKLESVSNLHFLLKNTTITVLKNEENMKISKKNMKDKVDISKKNMKDKVDISKKEYIVSGTLNNVNQFYYDSKDNTIKFEQTQDIYYSLLLNSEFQFQKGVAFKDILPLDFEKKENMMKDNVYYINSVLKTPLGMKHSKLSNMELNMNSVDINKHFKGFLDSKYNIIIEPLSHVIHLNDFYKLEEIFKTKCSLMPIVMDIPHDGIELCNLLKYMTIQNEHIFGIILLSNRRSFIYVYSEFSKANHTKIHSYILTELYKTNGITLKQPAINDLFIENADIYKNMNIDISKNIDFKNLKELLPLKINEIFYIVIFVLLYYFEVLKTQILKLKKKITYNLIEDLPIQNVKYDFSINTPFLNREWSEKLRQYCTIQNLNINDFLQIICSSIIQKTDSKINIYNTLKTDNNDNTFQNILIYSRYSGCPMMNESPNLLPIYTRLYSSVREKIKVALSEKLTHRRNAIYINSKVTMIPVSAKPTQIDTFYSGSMRNMIGAVEFIGGLYGEINYNIFGIKVNNMYLIMSSVLWEMRELMQFILT
jgi:hypothetical protein